MGIAAAAIIGAEYLAPLFTGGRTPGILTIQLTAAGLVLVLLVINFLGIRSGAWAQNVLSLLKVAMIAVLSAAAFRPGTPQVPAASLPLDGSWVFALGIAFISVFYSYGGYQNTINFGADVKDPSRSIPRAIFFGMSIVVACYLAVNVAYFRVLGMAGVASSKLVAAETARAAFGGTGGTIISLAIFLSAMGYLNVTLMQMPRAYYAMAADRTLPAFFMKVNPRTQTQEPGLLFLGGLILGSIFFLGTFESIINYVMFVDPITIAVVASTVFVLRRKAARGGIVFRGYRVPLYPLLPALFIIFELAVSVNVLLSRPKEALYGTIILAAGLPIFLIMRRVSGKTAAGDAGKTGDMGSSTGTAEG